MCKSVGKDDDGDTGVVDVVVVVVDGELDGRWG